MTQNKRNYVHMGFNNWLDTPDISAIITPGSAPSTRSVRVFRDENKLIDMTEGRKTKSILYLKSGYMVLSALVPETIIGRIEGTVGDSDAD